MAASWGFTESQFGTTGSMMHKTQKWCFCSNVHNSHYSVNEGLPNLLDGLSGSTTDRTPQWMCYTAPQPGTHWIKRQLEVLLLIQTTGKDSVQPNECPTMPLIRVQSELLEHVKKHLHNVWHTHTLVRPINQQQYCKVISAVSTILHMNFIN